MLPYFLSISRQIYPIFASKQINSQINQPISWIYALTLFIIVDIFFVVYLPLLVQRDFVRVLLTYRNLDQKWRVGLLVFLFNLVCCSCCSRTVAAIIFFPFTFFLAVLGAWCCALCCHQLHLREVQHENGLVLAYLADFFDDLFFVVFFVLYVG